MAKAILEFNLPEDESDFVLAKNGGKYYCTLFEIKNIMRKHWKYGEKMEDCWKEIGDELNDINFDEVE
jgi:hypothetical protein